MASSMRNVIAETHTAQPNLLKLPALVLSYILTAYNKPEKNTLMCVCKYLYARIPLIFTVQSEQKQALLRYVESGDKVMVKFLLDLKINPNYYNILGRTPLHYAIDNQHNAIIRLLKKHGANVNEPKPQIYPLHEAVYKQDEYMTKLLLGLDTNPNLTILNNITPLYIASQYNGLDIVKLLIISGAQVNIKTTSGGSPLHTAIENGHLKVAELLLYSGAKVNQKDKDGYTPLHLATERNDREMLALLLKFNPDVNTRNKDGWTPLCIAACNGYHEIAQKLLNAKANVNYATEEGLTPLCLAVYNGHNQMVKLLLDNEANIYHPIKNKKINTETTVLQIAQNRNHVHIVKLLQDQSPEELTPEKPKAKLTKNRSFYKKFI
jgi:ankyrin repeat protein